MEIVGRLDRLHENAYRLAAITYVAAASNVPGVLAIFRHGGRAPGISDLDLLTVVDDRFDPKYAPALTAARARGDGVTFHAPHVIPASLFSSASSISALLDVETLWCAEGHALSPNRIEPLDRNSNLAYLLETSMYRHFFASIFIAEGRVGMRTALTHLWKLKRNADLCAAARIELPREIDQAVRRISEIRRAWCEDAREPGRAELADLLSRSLIHWRTLFKLALREIKLACAFSARSGRIVITRFNERLELSAGTHDLEVRVSESRVLGRTRRYYVTRAPLELAAHLSACGVDVCRELALPDTGYSERISRRAGVIDKHRAFLFRRGIESTTYRAGAFPLLPRPSLATALFDLGVWMGHEARREARAASRVSSRSTLARESSRTQGSAESRPNSKASSSAPRAARSGGRGVPSKPATDSSMASKGGSPLG